MSTRLNESVAVAQQYFTELADRLGEIEKGNLGEGAKRKRTEWLLERLDRKIVAIHKALSAKVSADDESPFLGMPASHATFLRERLLPHAKLLQTAHLKASGSELLLELLEDIDTESSRPVWNAIRFTTDYTSEMLAPEDERQWEVRIVQDALDQPWFRPDRWQNNLRALRPVLVGRDESSIPPSVRFRLRKL